VGKGNWAATRQGFEVWFCLRILGTTLHCLYEMENICIEEFQGQAFMYAGVTLLTFFCVGFIPYDSGAAEKTESIPPFSSCFFPFPFPFPFFLLLFPLSFFFFLYFLSSSASTSASASASSFLFPFFPFFSLLELVV
jgi:hypothetical protein